MLGAQLWSSTFLPSVYQGTYIPSGEREPDKLLANIRNEDLQHGMNSGSSCRFWTSWIDRISSRVGHQPELEAGIQTMEVAFRMQTEAPEVFDISKETRGNSRAVWRHDFGRGCLTALRLVERGTRMVQVYFGNFQPWDSHDDIRLHAKLAHAADGPIASLIEDLKARGLVRGYAADCGKRVRANSDDPEQRPGEGRVTGATTMFMGFAHCWREAV